MRSLFWCSAAVLLLAGCGGGGSKFVDPFAYNHSRPLAPSDSFIALQNKQVAVHVFAYVGANGAHVAAFLVAPKSKGRHPAVLFLHGNGGSREDFLSPAVSLAERGAVTMTITEPNNAQTFYPLVVDARRAFDLLDARADVDPKRLGLVGFSLGAQTAAILAGEDTQLKAVGIISGAGNATTLYWMPRAKHADLFFQAGKKDTLVPHSELQALIDAAPGKPKVQWYPTGDSMNQKAFNDQLAWQASELGLR